MRAKNSVKVINNSEQSIPTLQANGVTLETAESKAEAQCFYSTFNHCYPALQPCDMEDLIGDLVPLITPKSYSAVRTKWRFS